MDLPGEAYLFNLSLVAMTFAAVSVLVMLMRQTMGGKPSNFDIHLVTTFVAHGFVIAFGALLPSLVADFDLSPAVFWATVSGSAAVLLGSVMARTQRQRSNITKGKLPPFLMFVFTFQWIAVLLLIGVAVVPELQSMGLFKIALTLSLAMTMWSFVRRIASLLGDQPGEDWDPKRA